eukprot:TRINITY_DN62181_c0_g1_i1.p1 TRINITY_DN62181_c0_g1~~TRINITY_DN62181_c0_g1_i1.p1  ORF type:complete len:353 (+),score=77.09 TRINITY_DN62181_c0_g1_i1:74-1060(+)
MEGAALLARERRAQQAADAHPRTAGLVDALLRRRSERADEGPSELLDRVLGPQRLPPAACVAVLGELKRRQLAQQSHNERASAAGAPIWRLALGVLRRTAPTNARCYGAGIAACERSGAWGAALRLLQEMPRRRVAPDRVCYSTAVSACGRARPPRVSVAVGLLGEMRTRALHPEVVTYSSAMAACERGSDAEGALQLLGEMRQCAVAPGAIAFSAAVSACTKARDAARALSVFDQMRAAAVAPDAVAWNTALTACRYAAAVDRAAELTVAMRAAGIPALPRVEHLAAAAVRRATVTSNPADECQLASAKHRGNRLDWKRARLAARRW